MPGHFRRVLPNLHQYLLDHSHNNNSPHSSSLRWRARVGFRVGIIRDIVVVYPVFANIKIVHVKSLIRLRQWRIKLNGWPEKLHGNAKKLALLIYTSIWWFHQKRQLSQAELVQLLAWLHVKWLRTKRITKLHFDFLFSKSNTN